MPWKMKTASRVEVTTFEDSVKRSAFMVLAFWGFADPRGILGSNMSVRMRLFEGSERSSLARIWPMNPPAPVIRICMLKFVIL